MTIQALLNRRLPVIELEPSTVTLDQLKAEYAPYHTFPEFQCGFDAYRLRQYQCPKHITGVGEQAYDRGLEAAMRWERQNRAA